MLILATVTIKFATDGGLFDKAWEAVEDTKNAIGYEQNLVNELYTKAGVVLNVLLLLFYLSGLHVYSKIKV